MLHIRTYTMGSRWCALSFSLITRPDGMRYADVFCPCTTWAEARARLSEVRAEQPGWQVWLVGVYI